MQRRVGGTGSGPPWGCARDRRVERPRHGAEHSEGGAWRTREPLGPWLGLRTAR
jgi:hypothetical protein